MNTLKLDLNKMADVTASMSDTDLGRLFRAMIAHASGSEAEIASRIQRAWERVRPDIDSQLKSFCLRSETNTRNVTNRYESYTNRRRIVDDSYKREKEGASPLHPPPFSLSRTLSYNPPL